MQNKTALLKEHTKIPPNIIKKKTDPVDRM
jgi:hypothetical protein